MMIRSILSKFSGKKDKTKANNEPKMEKHETEIKQPHELNGLQNGNRFIGEYPKMSDSTIIFKGKNNILFCESGVKLSNCNIRFEGDCSIVFLSQSVTDYKINLLIHNNSVCHIGKNNYFNGVLHVIISEHKHLFIGNECFFSFDIWIRNADPHLIYSTITNERMNPSKSVFIGDHVWVGQSVMLLKGAEIDSGSIIGAKAVVTGKVSHNCIWAGNPSRKIKDSIFWNGACVHGWTQKDTDKSRLYNDLIEGKNTHVDDYFYSFDKNTSLPYEVMDKKFDENDREKKLDYLKQISADSRKNRFVHQLT